MRIKRTKKQVEKGTYWLETKGPFEGMELTEEQCRELLASLLEYFHPADISEITAKVERKLRGGWHQEIRIEKVPAEMVGKTFSTTFHIGRQELRLKLECETGESSEVAKRFLRANTGCGW